MEALGQDLMNGLDMILHKSQCFEICSSSMMLVKGLTCSKRHRASPTVPYIANQGWILKHDGRMNFLKYRAH